ncbi:MAG: ATP-binding protein [Candidatus Moranbacteria bacterium]|nr:ATP-binding protein [Candidatus Moranbacteria bacterium]
MKISKLSIENFKKFKERFEFDFSDQNFFVGENNTGKTSVIEAINYLLSGPQKDKKYKNLSSGEDENIIIEALICSDFENVDVKYQDYIFSEKGLNYMRIKRSSEEKIIEQSGKSVELNESKILCWNNANERFENPTGKNTTFNIIEVVTIFAKDHVDNVVSFDSSKILGKLIKSSVGDFFDTRAYIDFKAQHDSVFNTGPDSLKSRLDSLSGDISKILKEQWGELELSFKFNLIDNSNHLKKGSVLVKEGGIEHELEDKGSGLQRSIMLSMIQVLSKVHLLGTDNNVILCIDEPELNLHPKAQEKLAFALGKLSGDMQVIISTHSPYILKSFRKKSDTVHVFKNDQFANPGKLDHLSVLPFGPTLAEIQYFAYDLTPNDFHNELYGYLESQSKLGIFSKTKSWFNDRKQTTQVVSLQEYIRHSIHHPENTRNTKYTDSEIKQSIEEMINAI